MPYRDVTCSGDVPPLGSELCLAFEGVARAGVMEALVRCLQDLPSGAEACLKSHDEGAFDCQRKVEQAACEQEEAQQECEQIHAGCEQITVTNCFHALSTLEPVARPLTAQCMLEFPDTYPDEDCTGAWDVCYPKVLLD